MRLRKLFHLVVLSILMVLISYLMMACMDSYDKTVELKEFMIAYNEKCSYKYSGSILVAKGDRILLEEGYGMADYKNAIPNQPNTLFAIGSITKSFTALAIMQLQEKGLIDVNDPISKYLDGNRYGDEITIHHLLTHTSGLPWDGKVQGETYVPLEDNINYINKLFLMFQPGTSYGYSNAGYQLLAAIIEKVSGKSYNDYIENNLFKPLSMADSICGNDASYHANQSIGYHIDLNKNEQLQIYNFSAILGSGNIYSTVQDLFKYSRALDSNQLLGEVSTNELFKPHWGDLSNGYGYGWRISELYGHQMISHGGSIGGGGYTSLMIKFPENDYTLIFLTNNADNNALYEVSGVMSAILLGENYIFPGELEVININPDTLRKYTGTYVDEEGSGIVLYQQNDKLYVQHRDDATYELLPVSDIQFHYKEHENTIFRFTIDINENITGVEGSSGGVVYQWKRVN